MQLQLAEFELSLRFIESVEFIGGASAYANDLEAVFDGAIHSLFRLVLCLIFCSSNIREYIMSTVPYRNAF